MWTRSADDLSPFVGYRIFANGVQVTEHVNWYAETRVVLRHLTPATSYTFTVQAHDHNGNNSATSNAVPLTTEATSDVTPPSVSTNVRIVGSFGCPEFFVGWTQSSDDTDPQFAIEYEIYVKRGPEPACRQRRSRQRLRLRHRERREHVHCQGGRWGGEHLGGQQRGDGILLRQPS